MENFLVSTKNLSKKLSSLPIIPTQGPSTMWTVEDDDFCSMLIALSDDEFDEIWSKDHIFSRNRIALVAAIACRRGNLKVLMQCSCLGLNLVEVRVSPINVPLASLAAMFDNVCILKYLHQQGCDFFARDLWGRTPISLLNFEVLAKICVAVA